ncbi:hypothetical protein [Neisseria sp. CCUG12390]|uniref:hypothetical protein n=1 Tax=Neisseria sp. CCUG12390 TaxID=3392035 RepID=UPI003A0FFBCA
MEIKYYHGSLLAFFICITLSFIFFIPYGLNFNEKEEEFDEAVIVLSSPNRGERKIRLHAKGQQYWLSCYGFSDFCKGENINRDFNVRNVKILLGNKEETNFINGILLQYTYNNIYHLNNKFQIGKHNLLSALAVHAIFAFQLACFFLLIFIFLFIKRK